MKNKKIKLLVLALAIMIAIFAACKPSTPDNPNNPDTPDTPDNPTYVVPEGEYTIPKEDGYNQVTFYWAYPGVIENADVWVWWDGKEGSGYVLHECEYGAKAVINVPVGIEQVGFIVRRDCSEPGGDAWGNATKDYGEDRFAVLDGAETFIWLKSGDAGQYTSTDGGKTLIMIKKFTLAGMTSFNKIEYSITPKTTISSYKQVKVYDGDKELTVLDITNMGKESAVGMITIEEKLDISKVYEVEIEGYGRKPVVPTDIFDSEDFVNNLTYSGDDLGATINGDSTTFKVWAPTASKVVLDLYKKGDTEAAYKNVEMTRGDKGVWSHTEQGAGHGTYYTYTVTTSVGTQTATDPYAKSAGVNGNRSMVIDLALTNPEGWEESKSFKTGIEKYTDAVIWEVHVRDFSNKIESSQYKGKYLAFTERGLVNEAGVPVGVDYLLDLGITHVHLLPVYDYATVDEANPDSGFNWGYDPKNYNVPEGSYSTDPFNGDVRVKEFKQMVQALHNAGIGVVMDVVYNHTYDANSAFNKIVPYYYYRYTATGANSSASGCGNDTASERYMFGKFMVDSVKYWATEYDLDGFRFDLMGLHDLATMQEVESAVHTVNPEAIIYGEGWTMGSTVDGSPQANQTNISKITPTGDAIGGVAVFNDVIRDGLKGSVFTHTAQGYISGASAGTVDKIKFGIAGSSLAGQSWKVNNAMVINYMSAHDNHSLWDKLAISNADNTEEERAAMSRLGATVVMISRGTPFMQAGEEMLRSKDGDENSYKSSDAINNIRWNTLTKGSLPYETMQYYKGLIEMRKAHSIFRADNGIAITFKDLGEGRLEVTFDNHMGGYALAVINPTDTAITHTLNGEWKLVANGTQAGADAIATHSGEVTVNAYGVHVYVK